MRGATATICLCLAGALAAIDAKANDADRLGIGVREPARTQLAESGGRPMDFELTDQDAQRFRLRDLRGQTALVFFGFTHCQSVCPPTLQKLRQVYRALPEDHASGLINVFISVDGERDTPARMKDYLAPFLPGFVGLTGDVTAVKNIATEFSAIFFKGMPTDTAGGYDVEHTSQVYLVDREGRLRATFYNASVEDLVLVTRRVLEEKGGESSTQGSKPLFNP